MLIFILMMAQTVATPVDPATVQTAPVINSCPAEPSLIPPFGESCAAKDQASRVTAILGAPPERPVRAQRYKIINDGKVIANDRGDIIATARPCLLPTVTPEDPVLVAKPESAKTAGPTNPCKTQKFAMQLLVPVATGAPVQAEPRVVPKP